MRKERLLPLLCSICMVLILATLPFAAACAQPAPAPSPAPAPAPAPAPSPAPAPAPKAITLKAVTFWDEHNPKFASWQMFMDRVNERAKGELVIKWLGASDVIGPFDTGVAVKNGVIDITSTIGSFYGGLVPGLRVLAVSELAPREERESGVFDFLQEMHKKAGLVYLGRAAYSADFFNFFINVKITTPYELAGTKLADGITEAFIRGLDATPVEVDFPDIYTAMERGVIDGVTITVETLVALGVHEVTDYMIDEPFYACDVVNIINPDTWNGLPKHLQDLITEVMIEVERDYPAVHAKIQDEAKQDCQAAGMEFIKFSPADSQWWHEAVYQNAWADLIEKNPESSIPLKEMMTK